MPPTASAIESYTTGKKYRQAVENSFDFDKYKPHIVPSSKKKHLHELFCFLTLRHMSRTPQAIERHVSGKRYKRALARWTKCKETGEKFVARGGGRQQRVDSDSDGPSGRGGGGSHWSDDNTGEAETDDDDMEDLYPAEHFGADDDDEEDSDGGEGEVEENLPPGPAQKDAEDAGNDSDYDMTVLDSGKEVGAVSNGTSSASTVTDKSPEKKKKEKKARKSKGQSSDQGESKVNGASSDTKKRKKSSLNTDENSLKKKKKK